LASFFRVLALVDREFGGRLLAHPNVIEFASLFFAFTKRRICAPDSHVLSVLSSAPSELYVTQNSPPRLTKGLLDRFGFFDHVASANHALAVS